MVHQDLVAFTRSPVPETAEVDLHRTRVIVSAVPRSPSGADGVAALNSIAPGAAGHGVVASMPMITLDFTFTASIGLGQVHLFSGHHFQRPVAGVAVGDGSRLCPASVTTRNAPSTDLASFVGK